MSLGAARVIYSINDLSLYVDQLTRGYVIALIQAERGPLWTPVPIATGDEYERWFGRTFSGSTDPLVIKMGLMQGAKFLIIRTVHVTDPSDPDVEVEAGKATVTLDDCGDIALPGISESAVGPFVLTAPAGGSAVGTEVGPYTFVVDVSDTFKIKIGTHAAEEVILAGAGVSVSDVVNALNAGTTNCTFYVTENNTVGVYANVITDNLDIEAVATDCYDQLGFIEAVHNIDAGTNSLTVHIYNESEQVFTLTAGARTASQVAADIAGITGGTAHVVNGKIRIQTTLTGATASVQVMSASTADTPLGFDNTAHVGSVAAAQDTLKFTAKDPGLWGDLLKVHIYDNRLDPGVSFDVRVTYSGQGGLNEFWSRLNMDPESDRYAVRFINFRSRLVDVVDMESTNIEPSNRPVVNANGTSLTGGDDMLSGWQDDDWIGDELVHTGIYAADKTDMSIDMMIPGCSSTTVAQTLVAYCEDRGLMAYIMVPEGFAPEAALAWRNGEDPYTFEKWNNCHMFIEYGRPTVYDSKYDDHVQVSNLGMLAACLSKNDVFYDYAHAPVGPRRGVVQMVEDLDWNMNDFPGYQDEFANNQVNYLEMTKSEGAVFWEQQTALIANSSMQQLNVMRFLLMMKKVFMPVLRTFIEEPNHPVTWGEVHRVLEPMLLLWKKQYAIYSYKLQTDRDAYFDDSGLLQNAVLNTGTEIQQGIYNARVLIQPTLAIRYFQFTVGVLATGTPYVNYEELHTLPGWVRR